MSIQVQKLGFSYDGTRSIFSDVSFSLAPGEIVCILGPNGIGKTTLFSCIANLRVPTVGEILIGGHDLLTLRRTDIAQKIGYVPQFVAPAFDYTVLEYVVTGWAPWLNIFEKPGDAHYARAEAALQQMEIAHLQNQPYSRLSGGEMQLVSIARALVQRTTYILMDEPTAHLDYGNQIRILRMVRRLAHEGYGILMTTHHPDHVLMLDAHVGVFDRQALFTFGPWQEIFDETRLSALYGVPVRLLHHQTSTRPICFVETL